MMWLGLILTVLLAADAFALRSYVLGVALMTLVLTIAFNIDAPAVAL